MDTNEIINNVDIQDVASEVADGIDNVEMSLPGKVGIGLCSFAVVASLGYTSYKLAKWGMDQFGKFYDKKMSEIKHDETEVETVTED